MIRWSCENPYREMKVKTLWFGSDAAIGIRAWNCYTGEAMETEFLSNSHPTLHMMETVFNSWLLWNEVEHINICFFFVFTAVYSKSFSLNFLFCTVDFTCPEVGFSSVFHQGHCYLIVPFPEIGWNAASQSCRSIQVRNALIHLYFFLFINFVFLVTFYRLSWCIQIAGMKS